MLGGQRKTRVAAETCLGVGLVHQLCRRPAGMVGEESPAEPLAKGLVETKNTV